VSAGGVDYCDDTAVVIAPGATLLCGPCARDAECASGYCDVTFGLPGFCDALDDCRSSGPFSSCGAVGCNATNGDCACGPTGAGGETNQPICAACRVNEDCASGYCNLSGGPTGFCDARLSCDPDGGSCGAFGCDSTSGSCLCGSDAGTSDAGSPLCGDCLHDADCASGYCNLNYGGAPFCDTANPPCDVDGGAGCGAVGCDDRTGTCACPQLQVGAAVLCETCTTNADCQSGYCDHLPGRPGTCDTYYACIPDGGESRSCGAIGCDRAVRVGTCLCAQVDAGEPPPATERILCLGDSLTHAGCPDCIDYPELLRRYLPTWQISDQGFSGKTTAQIIGHWDAGLSAQPWEVVIIEGGVNDNLNDFDQSITEANLLDLYTQARAGGAALIVMTEPPLYGSAFWDATRQARLETVNTWIRGYAQANAGPVALVDLYALMGDPANPQQYLPLYDRGDHEHPSFAGALRIAQEMAHLLNSRPFEGRRLSPPLFR
jgi:lysophospholipase L1-like esterase